jgi:hypothetical protein
MAFMDLKKLRRYQEMRFTFKDKNYLIKLCSYDSKDGFNHKGELFLISSEEGFYNEDSLTIKIINYFNRTWEAFTFESLILCLLDKHFKKSFRKDKEAYLEAFNKLMEDNAMPQYKKHLSHNENIKQDLKSQEDFLKLKAKGE